MATASDSAVAQLLLLWSALDLLPLGSLQAPGTTAPSSGLFVYLHMSENVLP